MERDDSPKPPPKAHWGVLLLVALAILVPMALSMGIALLAILPFFILIVPAIYLIWREHEYTAEQARIIDPELAKALGPRYSRLARKRHVVDDRVVK